MSASKTMRSLVGLLGAVLTFAPAVAMADYRLNMHKGVTKVSHEIYDIHMIVLWIVTIVGIAVFSVLIWSIINHRKSKGVTPATFHESTTVEVIWTVIPFIILVAIAVPATKTILTMSDMSHPDLNIKVTGWQWKWEYDYLDNGVHFFSNLADSSVKAGAGAVESGENLYKVDHYLRDVDNPMVVPVGKKVRLLITGADVIHSWWVPQLGVKHDAIPGHINESWFRADKVGIYRGQCAELCGKGHGYMPIVVKVVSENDYKSWVAGQKQKEAASAESSNKTYTKPELMAHGKKIYDSICFACHQLSGKGLPGVFPALAGSKIVQGPKKDHIDRVVFGKPGTAMQAYGKQLSPYDIASVITYERNSFGNHDDDMVQPSEVVAVEKSK